MGIFSRPIAPKSNPVRNPVPLVASNPDEYYPGTMYTTGGSVESMMPDMKQQGFNHGTLYTLYGPQPVRSCFSCKDSDPCAAGWAHSQQYYWYEMSVSGHMPGQLAGERIVQTDLIRDGQINKVYYEPIPSYATAYAGQMPATFAPQTHYGPMVPSQLAMAVLGSGSSNPTGGA